MDPKVIKAKIAKLKSGHKPRVLDLFSGCGFYKDSYPVVAGRKFGCFHGTPPEKWVQK